MSRFEWMDYALCAQVDGDLFFPASGDNGATDAAKRICGRCVVTAPCALFLAGFARQHDSYGIVGELSPRGRGRLRRELLAGDAA